MLRLTTTKDLVKLNELWESNFYQNRDFYKHYTPFSLDRAQPRFEPKHLYEWEYISFVSEFNGEIAGSIRFHLDREDLKASEMAIIAFKPSRSFLNDTIESFNQFFNTFNLRKVEFSTTGEIQKRLYRKFVESYGGRVVGFKRESSRLYDGKFYDKEFYEIFKEDFNISYREKTNSMEEDEK